MDITYTAEEFEEFKRLYMATGSHDNLTRIHARLNMRKFSDTHGRDKCDAMYAKIEAEEHHGTPA